MNANIEHRALVSNFEVRDSESGGVGVLRGYAAVFSQRSENLGGFREEIAAGAFDGVLNDDVRAFFNHDESLILGRTASNTLRISVDDRGLAYEVDLPDTQTARDLIVSVNRGDVSQSSFGFTVARDGDVWDEERTTGVVVRTITKIAQLWDVSPVSIPAYPQTDVAARSLEAWKKQHAPAPRGHTFRSRLRLAQIT